MSDTTLRREVQLSELRNTNARLRRVIVDFLESPYHGQPAISLSIMAACMETQHRAKRTNGSCVCGRKT